jgi:hypothetical protein
MVPCLVHENGRNARSPGMSHCGKRGKPHAYPCPYEAITSTGRRVRLAWAHPHQAKARKAIAVLLNGVSRIDAAGPDGKPTFHEIFRSLLRVADNLHSLVQIVHASQARTSERPQKCHVPSRPPRLRPVGGRDSWAVRVTAPRVPCLSSRLRTAVSPGHRRARPQRRRRIRTGSRSRRRSSQPVSGRAPIRL